MSKRKEQDKEHKLIREEALMYLREVIIANRAIKEWMVKNTNYAVLALAGVFFVFKDLKEDVLSFLLAFILMGAICYVSIDILNSNRNSIEKLRQRERDLINKIPLNTIKEYWAGGELKEGRDNRYFRIYVTFIFVTCAILLFSLWRTNAEARKVTCSIICGSDINAKTDSFIDPSKK